MYFSHFGHCEAQPAATFNMMMCNSDQHVVSHLLGSFICGASSVVTTGQPSNGVKDVQKSVLANLRDR